MKALLLFILLLCQLTTVNGQQTGCRIPVILLSLDLGLSSTQTAQSPQPIAQGGKDTVVSSPLSVDFYINQINLADSLYKNYLPQYNYDEVKAAVEFFEKLRTLESENLRNVDNSTSQVLKFSDSQFLYQCARAHYYHAVGLTERDDIVGACEHYLLALEIMLEDETLAEMYGRASKGKSLKTKGRKSQGSQPIAQGTEEYEEIRFMALIYTRLGRLFYNEAYCDLSIQKYEKALRYVELIDNPFDKANVLKELGNAYQLSGNNDSALYYYNESLKMNSNISNKLDVEKSIAMILFEKGEKDSAYTIMEKNIADLNNYRAKYSYYMILGDMHYKDNEYDKAIEFFTECIESQNVNVKATSAVRLSAIYDSIGDEKNKSYYESIYSKILYDDDNRSVEKARLQNVYDNYSNRIAEKEKIRTKKKVVFIVSSLIISSLVIITLIVYRHRKKRKLLSLSLDESERCIVRKDDIINQITKEIEEKEEQLKKFIFEQSLTEGKIKAGNVKLQKKEELIRQYEIEIKELSNRLERLESNYYSIDNYLKSKTCSKILKEISELSNKRRDTSELTALKQDELIILLESANKYLNNLIQNISCRYPKLKKQDMYYLCLVLIGLSNGQISSLLGVTYTAVRKRKNKICSMMGLDIKENLYNFLLNYY